MRYGYFSAWIACLTIAGLAGAQQWQPVNATSTPAVAITGVDHGAGGAMAVRTLPETTDQFQAPPLARADNPPTFAANPASPADHACSEPFFGVCNCPCPPPACVRISGEFLLWWINDGPLPVPIITSDVTNGTANPFTSAGLADPNTFVVFGNTTLDYGTSPGARFAADYEFAPALRIEGTGFFLGNRGNNFQTFSDAAGSPVLFRPIITSANGELSVLTSLFGPPMLVPISALLPTGGNANAGNLAAFPANFAGGVIFNSSSELWGAEANLWWDMYQDDVWTVSFLAGFRHLNLYEDMQIFDTGTLLPDPANPDDAFGFATFLGFLIHTGAAGDTITTSDQFFTRNRFYGGQLGVRAAAQSGPWELAGVGKIAMGATNQVIRLNAQSSLITAEGDVTTAPGGVLVPPFNIGRQENNEFAVVPELRVDVGYFLLEGIKLFAGYDFLYWTNVARPGNQIDLFVNDTLNPASPRFNQAGTAVGVKTPVIDFEDGQSNFFVHGLHFGLQLIY